MWKSLRELPREVWLLSVATLVNRAGTMVLPFLVLYLNRDLRIDASTSGLILALYGVGALITAPLSGRLSDHYGPVLIMKISLLVSGVMFFFYPLFRTIPSVAIATVVLAFATEMFRPASLTAVSHFVQPHQRKAAFALLRLALNLGMSIGPAVGGFIAEVSFFYLFVVDGATTFLAGIVLMLSFRNIAFVPHAKKSREHVEGMPVVREVRAWNDRGFLYFLAAMIPSSIVFFQHIGAMPLFLVRDLQFTESLYGILFTINTGVIILFEVPLNLAMAHWSFRRTLTIGAFLLATGFGFLAVTDRTWLVVVSVLIWTAGEMILFPSSAAFVAHIAPAHRQGEYMGLYTMSFSVAFGIGPWLGTMLLDRFGGPVVWLCMLTIGLCSAGMFALIRAEQSQEPGAAIT